MPRYLIPDGFPCGRKLQQWVPGRKGLGELGNVAQGKVRVLGSCLSHWQRREGAEGKDTWCCRAGCPPLPPYRLRVGLLHVHQPYAPGAQKAPGLTVMHSATRSFKGSACLAWFAIKIILLFYLSLEFLLIAERSLQPGDVQWCWVLRIPVMGVNLCRWKAWTPGEHARRD